MELNELVGLGAVGPAAVSEQFGDIVAMPERVECQSGTSSTIMNLPVVRLVARAQRQPEYVSPSPKMPVPTVYAPCPAGHVVRHRVTVTEKPDKRHRHGTAKVKPKRPRVLWSGE